MKILDNSYAAAHAMYDIDGKVERALSILNSITEQHRECGMTDDQRRHLSDAKSSLYLLAHGDKTPADRQARTFLDDVTGLPANRGDAFDDYAAKHDTSNQL